MPRITSDHCPIKLTCGDWEQRKPSYFKFANWWLEVGFKDLVKAWWLSFAVQGHPDFILATKLKLLKAKLKEWNTTNFGDLAKRKTELLNQLTILDVLQEQRNLTDDELIQKANITLDFEEISKYEESSWRQKSRILWLKQGDKNTKFFHKMANAHRRFNTIDKLEINVIEITEPVEINGEIISFCKQLYSETEAWMPNFTLQNFASITDEEQSWLERPFEEQEVLHSLKLCAIDKAPGPDGFSMRFFIACRDFLKVDILQTMANFHTLGIFEKSLNATYVALIPKKSGAKELRDFRPV